MQICRAVALLVAGLAVFALALVPTAVSAKKKDNPNYGVCKSGKKVTDTKKCKENGGKR